MRETERKRERLVSRRLFTYQTVAGQILIDGTDASPIKVTNERNARQTERILGRNHTEEVWIVFNCINGVRVGIGDLDCVRSV